jgi:HlyD family secretion protein
MLRSKKALLLAASVVLAMPAYLAFAAEEKATEAPAVAPSFPAIRVVNAVDRTLTDRVIVTGTVDAVEEVFIQPQVEALRVEKLNADVGDVVKAGDTLATLSEDALILEKSQLQANRAKAEAVGAQLQAQLAEAKANEAEAIRQANRAEKLLKSAAIAVGQAEQLRATATAATARVNSADQAILANKADVKVVDAQIDDIDLKLARTAVKTPVGGVISARNAKVGAIALGAGNPLFKVIRDNAIELKGDVAEGDLLRLKDGQKVHMSVAGKLDKVDGKVRTIDPVIDGTTRLGSVKIAIDDPANARIGMYASAEVIVSERKVLTLPLTAVTSEKDGIYVRKVVDNRVKMTKVVTGVQDGDFIEISSGLALGDVVVEKAGAYVRDGDRINPVFPVKTASN